MKFNRVKVFLLWSVFFCLLSFSARSFRSISFHLCVEDFSLHLVYSSFFLPRRNHRRFHRSRGRSLIDGDVSRRCFLMFRLVLFFTCQKETKFLEEKQKKKQSKQKLKNNRRKKNNRNACTPCDSCEYTVCRREQHKTTQTLIPQHNLTIISLCFEHPTKKQQQLTAMNEYNFDGNINRSYWIFVPLPTTAESKLKSSTFIWICVRRSLRSFRSFCVVCVCVLCSSAHIHTRMEARSGPVSSKQSCCIRLLRVHTYSSAAAFDRVHVNVCDRGDILAIRIWCTRCKRSNVRCGAVRWWCCCCCSCHGSVYACAYTLGVQKNFYNRFRSFGRFAASLAGEVIPFNRSHMFCLLSSRECFSLAVRVNYCVYAACWLVRCSLR